MKLRPSTMAVIRQKRAFRQEPLRMATCSRCGWKLAARSFLELEGEQWSTGVDPSKYLCATCDDALQKEKAPTLMSLLPAGAIPFIPGEVTMVGGEVLRKSLEDAFAMLPLAPEDAARQRQELQSTPTSLVSP